MMNVPKLRFKGFDGEWESQKIQNLTTKIGDGLHGTPNYVEDSEIYFINGNNIVNGSIKTSDSTKKVSLETLHKNKKELNANSILISINGTIGNLAFYDGENVMLGKSVAYLNFMSATIFYYYSLSTDKVQKHFISELTGTTIKNLSLKTLRETILTVPTLPEQEKIASFFTAVDSRLEKLKKKKEFLESYKKGVMQKIFSQELRFKDEKGNNFPDWEEKTLGEIASRITTKNKINNSNVLTISAQLGLISQLEYYNKSVAAKNLTGYYLLSKNDFAYNKSYSNGYPMGAIKRLTRYKQGVVSTLYICFRCNENIVETFLEQYFESGNHNSEIEKYAQEGARNHGLLNIGVNDFFSTIIPCPSLKEQQKIADFLTALDKKIDLVNQQISKTELWKKGLLQQMFV